MPARSSRAFRPPTSSSRPNWQAPAAAPETAAAEAEAAAGTPSAGRRGPDRRGRRRRFDRRRDRFRKAQLRPLAEPALCSPQSLRVAPPSVPLTRPTWQPSTSTSPSRPSASCFPPTSCSVGASRATTRSTVVSTSTPSGFPARRQGSAGRFGRDDERSHRAVRPARRYAEVSMTMNGEGTQEWARLTGENIGKCIAIVLDGYVYSLPRQLEDRQGFLADHRRFHHPGGERPLPTCSIWVRFPLRQDHPGYGRRSFAGPGVDQRRV